jgi:hypothetical protein
MMAHILPDTKTMKKSMLVWAAAIMVGCASDPMMTGEAHDWVGHKMTDLVAALGQPTRTIHQSDYNADDPAIARAFEGKPKGEIIILEYVDTGDAMSPNQGHISFGMHGTDSPNGGFGAHGGINTSETPAHESTYVNITRFEVRDGIVIKWFQSHSVDGVVQWAHH